MFFVSSHLPHTTSSSRRQSSPAVATVFVTISCLAAIVRDTSAGSIRLSECPADYGAASYRWVKSNEYLYVEEEVEGTGACVTPSNIYDSLGDDSPVVPVTVAGDEVGSETGIWLLKKHLYMQSNTTLLLHDDLGCEEFRLTSSSSNAIQLRAHGAYISLLRTKVFSWNGDGYDDRSDSEQGKKERSFIRAISEVEYDGDTCDGAADDTAGEARIDIINSEVAYLGYQGSEAYGISYKVHGYCKDGSNPEVFDRVNVWGDIRFSDIHHNRFGMYSYGHQDGLWEYNLMHDNQEYGFDPHDDSDNLRIHNNVVYGNGNHGIIASKRCNDVSIQNNEVWDNDLHGIMLHRSSDYAIVRNNTVKTSGDACIALFESFGIEVSNNTCEGNAQGIRLSMGSSYNKVFDNTIVDTTGRAYWHFKGSDEVEASSDTGGRCTDNLFENNYIETAEKGVYMTNTNDNKVIGNVIKDVEENEFEDSDGLLWKDNVVEGDFEMKITDTCLDDGSDLDQIADAGGETDEC